MAPRSEPAEDARSRWHLAITGAFAALLVLLTWSPVVAQESAGALRNADCTSELRTDICEGETKPRPSSKHNPADAQQQRTLMESALAGLAPQRAGTVDLYVIGVAGWAGENVFIRELEGALAVLSKILPVDGRIVRLVNHRNTIRALPLATADNLAAAVSAVGKVMDKDEDVLILFMTSHGTPDGFGLRLPRRPPVELAPGELGKMLDGAGIKHRLVIVSACFSGTFVAPLANENTIVMTASDPHNTSFGCAPGRRWTYFGDALFNRSLRPGVDLPSAFQNARERIGEWEAEDKLTPSNPQAHFGPSLRERLKPFFAAKPGQGD